MSFYTPSCKAILAGSIMPYCWKCGAKLDEDAKFCPTCGTPVAPPVAKPERRIDREVRRPISTLAIVLTVLIVVIVVVAAIIVVYEKPQQPVKGISMTADYWSFDPSTITVKKGETVRLVITSVNNMMPMMPIMFPNHGIEIEGYDIDYTLPVGVTVTIEFVADKAGEFHFHCSVYCGLGHEDMHGELIVED